MSDERFWNSLEALEGRLLGSELTEAQFRSAMRKKGLDQDVIDERVEAVQSDYRSIYGCDHISLVS